MEKIAWITDSTSSMDPELAARHSIHIVPLDVIFGEQTYKELTEISPQEFYERMGTESVLPTTSQPSVGSFYELYKDLKTKFAKGIAVHITSVHSGTCNTSKMAAEMAEFPVEVIDSKVALEPMAEMVLEGVQMQEAGNTYQEIVNRIRDLSKRVKLFFLVDDLAHLQRGGRLNMAQFLMGSLLSIKPLLAVIDGKITPFEKIRTYKKAKERLLDMFFTDANDGTATHVNILHTNNFEEAKHWQDEIKAKFPNVTSSISFVGPVIGVHVGPGAIGISWFQF